MAKKSKKSSNKKRQEKALKRRSRQKQLKKLSAARPKRQMPGMPAGMPGGLPGNLPPAARKMMEFSEPLLMMADPSDMNQVQQAAALTQGFWSAFALQDEEKRAAALDALQAGYQQLSWAQADFSELCDLLLKRHIHLLPESHSAEERARFSEEEIEAALQVAGEETAGMAETEADGEAVSPTSGTGELPPLNGAQALAALPEEARSELAELQQQLREKHEEIDFIRQDDPLLAAARRFRELLTELFERGLREQEVAAAVVPLCAANLTYFLKDFLEEFRRRTLFSCSADDLEEFMLDYFPRKIQAGPAHTAWLPSSLRRFFELLGGLEFITNSGELLQRIEESTEEFEELGGM